MRFFAIQTVNLDAASKRNISGKLDGNSHYALQKQVARSRGGLKPSAASRILGFIAESRISWACLLYGYIVYMCLGKTLQRC